MKYKPCCDTVCCVHGCETRSQGGCYCVCRLVDNIGLLKSLIEDSGVIKHGFAYLPPQEFEKYIANMTDEDKEYREKQKEWARDLLLGAEEKLKKYEI